MELSGFLMTTLRYLSLVVIIYMNQIVKRLHKYYHIPVRLPTRPWWITSLLLSWIVSLIYLETQIWSVLWCPLMCVSGFYPYPLFTHSKSHRKWIESIISFIIPSKPSWIPWSNLFLWTVENILPNFFLGSVVYIPFFLKGLQCCIHVVWTNNSRKESHDILCIHM